MTSNLIPVRHHQYNPSIFVAAISRNKNLSAGRLLKVGKRGKLILSKNHRESRFVFIRYVGDSEYLRAEVGVLPHLRSN